MNRTVGNGFAEGKIRRTATTSTTSHEATMFRMFWLGADPVDPAALTLLQS